MGEYKIIKDMYSRTRMNYGNNMNKRTAFQVKNSFKMLNQMENEMKSTKKNVNIPKRLTKNECRRYQEKVSKLNYDKIKPNLPVKMKWTTPKHKKYNTQTTNIVPLSRYNDNNYDNNDNNDIIWCLEKDKSWADEMEEYEHDNYVEEYDDYMEESDNYMEESDEYDFY